MTDKQEVSPKLDSLADRINYLFAALPPPDGSRAEYANQHVLTWLREHDYELSPSHISELRRGIKTNPTMRVLQGLANFFEVRVGFFYGDTDAVRDTLSELRLRRAMRENQVTDIAARVAGMSPAHRHLVADFITDVIYKHGKGGSSSST
ncbi:hypothetical protein [Pseudonocardia sp. ICBG601]|uniref:hypothetical protein n=1 Tax=Pseudonocardia sp. ICBG601 TaxID=2846759 RepID=UPI001CF63A60|nr:hypothetical protein [Pseudonocardia sp. ICBG601]